MCDHYINEKMSLAEIHKYMLKNIVRVQISEMEVYRNNLEADIKNHKPAEIMKKIKGGREMTGEKTMSAMPGGQGLSQLNNAKAEIHMQ